MMLHRLLLCLRFLIAPAVVVINTATHAQQADATLLQPITVTGEDYVEYRPENTRSATRTDTPIKEIAQSVSVIPKEVLEDLGETSMLSALELGGVGQAHLYAGGLDVYTVRGFRSGAYSRNGMAADVGFGTLPDAVGIESLDVMRGPSSTTFGASDPGGTFSVVTKQPLADPAYGLGLTWDEHGGRRGTADLTGPLNASGTLLYRVNAAVSGGRTFRDYVRNHREYFAPRLSWQLTPQTRVLLDMDWSRADAPLDRGIPISPRLRYGPPSRSFFHGDPNAGRVRSRNTVTQLRLEQEFSENWRLDTGLQYITGGVDGYSLQLRNLQADGRTYTRRFTLRENRWRGKLAQTYLNGKVRLGGVEHRVLAGVEYKQTYSRIDHRNAPDLLPLDVYNPVYGVAMPKHNVAAPSNRPGTVSRNRALVLQDQVYLTDAFNVLAGLRYDRYRAQAPTASYKNDVFTPRLGLSYAFSDAVSAYVSYARSFKPNNSQDANGNTFDAERGTSWEVGLKTDLFDRRLLVTTALFHTVKTNILTSDPLDPDIRVLAGEVRSRGLDISATGKIGDRTRMIAYAGWLDAEITKDNNPAMPPGTRLQNVPKRRMHLLVMHGLTGRLQGMEVGAGLQYVGSTMTASNVNALRMPSYSTVNLMLNYQVNQNAKLRLILKNLFDKVYYTRNTGDIGFPGDPRTFYAALEYKI